MARIVRKRKMSVVAKVRVFFTVIVILGIISTLGYNCIVNVLKIIFYLSSYLLNYELRLQFQRVK